MDKTCRYFFNHSDVQLHILRPRLKLWNSPLGHLGGGHSSVTPVIFSIEMHFGLYALQNWNLTKSVQSISLKWRAELLRLHCTGSVYYCGLSFFLYNRIFFFFFAPGRRDATDAPGFHHACSSMLFFAWVLIPVTHFTSQLLCLCSRQRDIKPRLHFAQWQTTQKTCLQLWHLTGRDTFSREL